MLLDFDIARAQLPRPTRRTLALIAIGLAIAIIGIVRESPSTVGTGSALALGALGYMVLQGIKEAAISRVQISRIVPHTVRDSSETVVRVIAENPTPLWIDASSLLDSPPPTWRPQGHAATASIPPWGRAVMEYRVRPVPGRHAFGPVRLAYMDLLSTTRIEREEAVEPRELVVPPRILDLPKRGLTPPRAQLPPGVASMLRQRGQGHMFLELREYMPEDDIRMVDWKASARTGRLMVKVMEKQVTNYVLVYLLYTSKMFRGIVGETKAEYAARLATSIAYYLSKRGDNFAIIVAPPGRKKAAITSWLRGRAAGTEAALHIARATDWSWAWEEKPFRNYSLIASDIRQAYIRRKILLFLITDFNENPANAARVAETLQRLRPLGIEPVAVVPVTVAFEAKALGEAAPLYRLLQLDQIKAYHYIRRELTKKGIPTVIAGPLDLLQTIIARIEAALG